MVMRGSRTLNFISAEDSAKQRAAADEQARRRAMSLAVDKERREAIMKARGDSRGSMDWLTPSLASSMGLDMGEEVGKRGVAPASDKGKKSKKSSSKKDKKSKKGKSKKSSSKKGKKSKKGKSSKKRRRDSSSSSSASDSGGGGEGVAAPVVVAPLAGGAKGPMGPPSVAPPAVAALPEGAKGPMGPPPPPTEHVVIVSALDEKGRQIRSLADPKAPAIERADLRLGSRKGKRKQQRMMEDGERSGYFQGDAKEKSLEDLVREEKEGGWDMDETFAKNLVKAGRRFKPKADSRAGFDEEDEVDVSMYDKKEDRLTEEARLERDRKRAIEAERKVSHTQMNCWLCFKNPKFKKHLIVSLAEQSYLALPQGQAPIVPGHCQIVPMEHVLSINEADEDVYEEILKFKAALDRMYTAQGRGCIFLETSYQFHRNRHAVIDVLPMDKESVMDAPLYFSKAIVESEEWTQNKRLIDTTGKGVRRSVPKGFPYFDVSWRGGGYAHVIEEEDSFPRTFGFDIAKGMMDLPPDRFGRRENRWSFESQRVAVLAFLKDWKPFDWTVELDGGEYADAPAGAGAPATE